MPRRPSDSTAARRSEVVAMLRSMPTKWRRAYNTARRTLVDNGGPVLPEVPTPEQAMLILGNTAGRNRDTDQPTGDQPVPQAVRDEAMHGLRLSYANDYPGWEFFGIARAIQLVLSPGVPMRTRERMKRYLTAHEKDKAAPHFGDEERPSNGYMAWLNWGGDAGLAWNEGVERATYSSRTRGQSMRRKNPIFYRPSDGVTLATYRPSRPDRFAERVAATGPSAFQHFGDDQPFWTRARLDKLFDTYPNLRAGRFATKYQAQAVVKRALTNMVENGEFPDLAPAGGRIHVGPLANAVPLYRVLGDAAPLSASTPAEMTPIAIGLVTHAGTNAHAWGKALQLYPNTFDFGAGPTVPLLVEKHTVRPSYREVRVGDIIYTIPHGYENILTDYKPYRVTAVRTLRGSKLPPDVNVPTQQVEAISIEEPGSLSTLTLLESDFLRADEMPPAGTWTRVTPAQSDAALAVSQMASARRARAAAPVPAPAPAPAARAEAEALVAAFNRVHRTRASTPATTPEPAPAAATCAIPAPGQPVQQEALTADAIATPRAKPGKKKSTPGVIAVVYSQHPSSMAVALLDDAVAKRKTLTENDILGYATATYYESSRNAAEISVAAAEKGYANLLYGTLANAFSDATRFTLPTGVRKPALVGSYCQTEYAKRFWAKQPNGKILPLSEKDFRAKFGVDYAKVTKAGDALVQRLMDFRGMSERDARHRFYTLGNSYFGDYYSVSSAVSRTLGPSKVPRPAAPREVSMHLIESAARPIRPNNLALIDMGRYAVLVEVPRGESTLEPKNMLAYIGDWSGRTNRRHPYSVERFGRFASTDLTTTVQPVDALPPASRRLAEDFLIARTREETPALKRKVDLWLERGAALKTSLEAAGFSATDMENLFGYFRNALEGYARRARRVTTDDAMQVERNPRRRGVPLAVRVFMPI